MAELSLDLQWRGNQDLINACIAGKRTSQERLYQLFSPKMYAICLRYAENEQSAEDILQEGFVKVFNNLDKYRSEGSFEGWMKRIFVNTSIEHYRKVLTGRRFLDLEQVYGLVQNTADAESELRRKDLMSMVQRLPIGYRTVFNLYAIEGYTHKEISQMLDISEGTSKSQLARARATLQKMLKRL